MTTAAEKDYVSIGALAARTQRPVRRIEQAADSLKIRPALRLNGVVYFDAGQVERLTKVFSKQGKYRCR
jgi:hypothetical protein